MATLPNTAPFDCLESSPEALKFILVGVCVSMPAIAAYTIYSYRVFRGKTGEFRYA